MSATRRLEPRTRRPRGTFAAQAALVAVACMIASPLCTREAQAAPVSEAELERLRKRFFEGIELEERGEWARAGELFREIAKQRTSPQVRYHIALCDENLGKLADALAGYEEAREMARVERTEAADRVVENADKRLDALRPRVPELRIERGEGDRRAVRIGGRAYLPAELAAPLRLDPGRHRVEVASSRGYELLEELLLAEGAREVLVLPSVEAPRVAVARSEEPPPVVPPPAPPAEGSRLPAVIVGGVGVLSLAGAGVLFGMSRDAIADVQSRCPEWETGTCPRALQARADEGATFHDTSIVLGAVGVAAVATAVVLWVVLEPPDPAISTTRSVSLAPWAITGVGAGSSELALQGGGALLEGRF